MHEKVNALILQLRSLYKRLYNIFPQYLADSEKDPILKYLKPISQKDAIESGFFLNEIMKAGEAFKQKSTAEEIQEFEKEWTASFKHFKKKLRKEVLKKLKKENHKPLLTVQPEKKLIIIGK